MNPGGPPRFTTFGSPVIELASPLLSREHTSKAPTDELCPAVAGGANAVIESAVMAATEKSVLFMMSLPFVPPLSGISNLDVPSGQHATRAAPIVPLLRRTPFAAEMSILFKFQGGASWPREAAASSVGRGP